MERTTTSKAVAGGVAANTVVIALWLLTLIPKWEAIPLAPQGAIIALVTAAIGYGFVYFAPANQSVLDQ